MKKTIIIIGCSVLILSFGDSGQTSFSQKNPNYKPVNKSQKDHIKDKKFEKDTSYLNRLIGETIDCLRVENEKTSARIEGKMETIKIQKMNERDLSSISKLLNKGLSESSNNVKNLPPVKIINATKEVKELDVNISPLSPDSIPIPVHKKRFFDFLKFWR